MKKKIFGLSLALLACAAMQVSAAPAEDGQYGLCGRYGNGGGCYYSNGGDYGCNGGSCYYGGYRQNNNG